MDRTKLDAAAKEISDYTAKHVELRKAHSFVYDYPPFEEFRSLGEPELVVMGINPGETEPDRLQMGVRPNETEEERKRREAAWTPLETTWNGNFRSQTPSAHDWAEAISYYTESRRVVSTEIFFWSANDAEEIEKRYGHPWWRSPHLKFCVKMNRLLIAEYQPKAVIFVGISARDIVARKFGLVHVRTIPDASKKTVRLVAIFRDTDSGLPWIFTRHWTSKQTMLSNTQKEQIRNHIQLQLSARV
jgi:hypothetical protein